MCHCVCMGAGLLLMRNGGGGGGEVPVVDSVAGMGVRSRNKLIKGIIFRQTVRHFNRGRMF